jgi:hypothetical protein
MKRCDCLRYLVLQAGRKDESVYIFVEEDKEDGDSVAKDGKLVTIESAFPLQDYEPGTGALKCICPYFNFLHNGVLITRAFKAMEHKRLGKEDMDLIKKAVEECEHFVNSKKFLIFNERYKEVIDNFCEKYKLKPTWRLLKLFLSFLKVRTEFMDKSLCKDQAPSEKKLCFDQLWVDSFGRYLESVGFVFNQ